jgi:hypothetical protein
LKDGIESGKDDQKDIACHIRDKVFVRFIVDVDEAVFTFVNFDLDEDDEVKGKTNEDFELSVHRFASVSIDVRIHVSASIVVDRVSLRENVNAQVKNRTENDGQKTDESAPEIVVD